MDEIELNGVKYIRKDLAEQQIKDSKVLKKEIDAVFEEFEERITQLLEDDKLDIEMVIEKPYSVKLSKKQMENLLMPSSHRLYANVNVQEDGSIILGQKTVNYTINDIKDVQAEIDAGTLTKDKLTFFKKQFSVTIQQMHRIVYNILNGMFNGKFNGISNSSPSQYQTSDNAFNPSAYVNAKQRYQIHTMEETGKLCATGSNFNLNIQQVLQIQSRVCDKDITVARAKQIAKDMDMSYPVLCRIAWNIENGYFDVFIKEWKARLNNFVDDTVFSWSKIDTPIENNPEKRRDNGYYTSQ